MRKIIELGKVDGTWIPPEPKKKKSKKSEYLKQLQDLAKIKELLVKQMAQYEFDKAEYQRTGIQH